MRRTLQLVAFVACFASIASLGRSAEPKPAADPNANEIPVLAGATVSVPWPELRSLFVRGSSGQNKAPVEFVWVDASYSVDATKPTAQMAVTATVRVLSDHWAAVSLGPAGGSLVRAVADKKPCPVFLREGQLFALLSGKGEHQMELVLEGSVRRVAGGSGLAVPLVPAPLVTLEVKLPAKELDVAINGAVGLKLTHDDKQSIASSSVRGDRTASVTWKPRSKVAVDPIVSANVETLITAGQSGLYCRSTVTYNVVRAGVDRFQLLVPAGAELRSITGRDIAAKNFAKGEKGTIVTVDLVDTFQGVYRLEIVCATRVAARAKEVSVPFVTPLKVSRWEGDVAIEGAVNAEIASKPTKLERIDVAELPANLRRRASRAIVLAYHVTPEEPELTLTLERHEDVRVLVAMCDVCEASTVFTPDGRKITKMMYVTRNNAKPFLTLELPKDAQVWSALVDDRPVSPARNAKGQLLVPLTKSQPVDEDDEHSYQHRRDQRRRQREGELRDRVAQVEPISDRPRDLKPYDVEIVFVQTGKEAEAKGELTLELPQCDIPVGRMAWAVFLPDAMRIVDVEGNLKEVRNFSLPFVHFGEAAYRRLRASEARAHAAQLKESLRALEQAKAIDQLAEQATAEGVLPVRVELPIAGELIRFEKLLLVNEAPRVKLLYRTRAQ